MAELVTICIPTYNGEAWIREAVRSALAQTYTTTEVLVVDDASTDNTTGIVRSIHDSRIRLEINRRRLGLVRNWNQCLRLSKGKFIKPLFQDDVLYPRCVQYMQLVLAQSENIGLVFALRDILVRNASGKWVIKPRRIVNGFGRLQSVNRGEPMFREWLRNGYRENWIGEPSSVMLRKSCLTQTGLFNIKMWMCADFELWMRIMHLYDIGFVNQPLSAFRVHSESATIIGTNLNMHWLDTTWLIEGLLAAGLGRKYPELRRLRIRELLQAIKYEVWRLRRRYRINPPSVARSFVGYSLYRLGLLFGLHPNIHETLTP
jgi:glycosyltransferase involved in cell wall biosynthesis